MKKLLMMMILILIVSSQVFAKGIKVPEDIRIGIFYKDSAKSSITLSSPGGIKFGVMKDGEFEYYDEVGKDEEIVVKKGSSANSVIVSGYDEEIGSKSEYPYFMSVENKGKSLIKINDTLYRGNVEIKRLSRK